MLTTICMLTSTNNTSTLKTIPESNHNDDFYGVCCARIISIALVDSCMPTKGYNSHIYYTMHTVPTAN